MKGFTLIGRGAALLSAVALSSVALVAFAAPAQAAPLGTLTLTPTSGTVTDPVMLTGAATNAACPTGYGTNATLKVGKAGGPYSNLNKSQAANNYDQAPFTLAANRSMTGALGGVAPTSGDYNVVILCTGEILGDHADLFVATITVTGGNWALKQAPVAQPTTTLLGLSPASPVARDTNVTFTASVSPATAAGTVQFFRGVTAVGAPVAVVNGSAVFSSTTLPVGAQSLSAAFTATDPAAFGNSASAAAPYTVTPPAGAITRTGVITADIDQGAFALELTGFPVALTGGTVGGTATGTLNNAKVTDLRGSTAGWNLTGQVGDFTGAGTIGAANLGWVPNAAKVSGSGAVVAGGTAAPGTGGLDGVRTLCKATGGTSAGVFTCGAQLNLLIPDTTAPGAYSATLTLTLA